jgi:hypothetical protein
VAGCGGTESRFAERVCGSRKIWNRKETYVGDISHQSSHRGKELNFSVGEVVGDSGCSFWRHCFVGSLRLVSFAQHEHQPPQ